MERNETKKENQQIEWDNCLRIFIYGCMSLLHVYIYSFIISNQSLILFILIYFIAYLMP